MEVTSPLRWGLGVAAVAASVSLLVGIVSWRVAVALPAPWVTPSVVAVPQGSESGPTEPWTASVPAGWSVPKDTYGQSVSLTDANGNRISGDQFSQSAERACAYLVDQQLGYQKFTRTDIAGVTVDGRPAISVRLVASNEGQLFRCFPGNGNADSWYLKVRYRPQDQDSAEKAFAAFADSFRLK